jgi:replicative DNA helicase
VFNNIAPTLPQDVLFSSAESVRLGMENLSYRRNNKHAAVPIGLRSLDKYVLPLLPGELMTLLARPGGGKTGFMLRWARERAQWLMNNKRENKAVVFVSCEQTVEELDSLGAAAYTHIPLDVMARGELNDTQWHQIKTAAVFRGALPFYWIAPSKEKRKKRPRITPGVIIDTLLHLEATTGIKPDICFVDYLQLLKSDGRPESKTIEVTNNLELCKDGALATDCPWVVSAQAKREVDLMALPIPGLDSGQWTSAIEQYSDKVASLVRPSKYKKQGEQFGSITVEGHSQLLFSLLKQKLGNDNIAQWVHFDPAYNLLHELESRYAVT